MSKTSCETLLTNKRLKSTVNVSNQHPTPIFVLVFYLIELEMVRKVSQMARAIRLKKIVCVAYDAQLEFTPFNATCRSFFLFVNKSKIFDKQYSTGYFASISFRICYIYS